MSDPKERTRPDAMGPTSKIDPSIPGAAGTEEIHGNTQGFPYREGEPEPEGYGYSGQGGVTGKKVRQAPPK